MEKALAQERIKELTELIEHYNYEYYMNDTSLISDHDFDLLLSELISLEKEFPEYAFEKHKGYGTKIHIDKIKEIGPCRLHRKTFIKNFWVEPEN